MPFFLANVWPGRAHLRRNARATDRDVSSGQKKREARLEATAEFSVTVNCAPNSFDADAKVRCSGVVVWLGRLTIQ